MIYSSFMIQSRSVPVNVRESPTQRTSSEKRYHDAGTCWWRSTTFCLLPLAAVSFAVVHIISGWARCLMGWFRDNMGNGSCDTRMEGLTPSSRCNDTTKANQMEFQNFGRHRQIFLFATIAWATCLFWLSLVGAGVYSKRDIQNYWDSCPLLRWGLQDRNALEIWHAQLFAKLVCLSLWLHLAWALFFNLRHALDFVGRGERRVCSGFSPFAEI